MSEFENVGDTSGSSTITALNGSVIAMTNGCSSVTFNITGTWIASLTLQAQNGDGNWFTTQGLIEPSSVLVQVTSINNVITVNCGGFAQVRLTATSFTSGTATISWNAGNGVNSVWAYNSNPSALNATVVQASAANLNATAKITDGTDILAINTDGSINADVLQKPANLSVTATAATGIAVTVTLPAVAAEFHYITMLEIIKYATAAITGTATPVLVTTTNFPAANVFTFGTAQAIGTTLNYVYAPALPIHSSVANTATTIVCPATASVIWRVNIWYYAAV